MDVNRRTVLRVLLGLLVAARPLFERVLPARVVEAMRHGAYPGPVRPIDERALRSPGRWAG